MGEVDRLNLTGAWFGAYSYLGTPRPDVSFIASIEEVAGLVAGTISEPNTIGGTTVHLGAILRGSREGREVTFTKAYDGASDAAHAIDYFGTLSPDGTRVTGFWKLPGAEGGFEMNRTHAEAEEEELVEAARVDDFGALIGR